MINHSFQSRAFSTAVSNIFPSWVFDFKCCKSAKQQIANETKTQMKQIQTLSKFGINIGNITPPQLPINIEQNNERSEVIIRLIYTLIVLLISMFVKRLKLLFKLTAPLISSSLVYTVPGTMILFMGLLSKYKQDKCRLSSSQWKLNALIIGGIIFILLGISCTSLGLYTFAVFVSL